jgi:hypothetical protein
MQSFILTSSGKHIWKKSWSQVPIFGFTQKYSLVSTTIFHISFISNRFRNSENQVHQLHGIEINIDSNKKNQ